MADTGSSSAQVAGYTQWQARDYFQTYYSEVVLPDEQVVLRYQIEQLARHGERFGRALEYGCGPTLHRAIAASHYVFRLDMADWLPDNLTMVREWLNADPANTDWRRFTEYVLHCESGALPSPDDSLQREAETRRVVRGLHASDARWRHPLGAAREGYYDAIVSGFCIDAVSSSKRVWRECMRNLLSMLAPGGMLVIHALHGCKAYKVGDRMFPGADLSLDDMVGALTENGCEKQECDVQLVSCPDNAVYGYSGILMAAARKG